mgnify:CR=1 FL=1
MNFGIANVTAITVICYLICEGVKTTPLNNKYVPIIAGVTGAILGTIGFLTHMPDFPAQDILTAIAVGIVSGLAATGANQIGKQMNKDKEAEATENEHTEGKSGDEV